MDLATKKPSLQGGWIIPCLHPPYKEGGGNFSICSPEVWLPGITIIIIVVIVIIVIMIPIERRGEAIARLPPPTSAPPSWRPPPFTSMRWGGEGAHIGPLPSQREEQEHNQGCWGHPYSGCRCLLCDLRTAYTCL